MQGLRVFGGQVEDSWCQSWINIIHFIPVWRRGTRQTAYGTVIWVMTRKEGGLGQEDTSERSQKSASDERGAEETMTWAKLKGETDTTVRWHNLWICQGNRDADNLLSKSWLRLCQDLGSRFYVRGYDQWVKDDPKSGDVGEPGKGENKAHRCENQRRWE